MATSATTSLLAAEPQPIALDWTATALVIIDMQRDFLEPGGFGETLGNDVSQLARAVAPCADVLRAARAAGILVVHTREGHLPDLSDAPPAKIERGAPSKRIGDPGPMGRILIRGEAGHDIIPALYPLDDEIVIDKPGKGAFYATELDDILQKYGIANLLVCGVTTEVCVNTTVREANDRGYRCVVLADCCASYFPEFHEMGLKMIKAQGGIFGWVSSSAAVLQGNGNGDFQPTGSGGIAMSTTMTASKGEFKPALWTPGDWNALFGFGTNILVNMLVLTGLLRFVLKMPDSLVFGRILPALGLMMCLSTFYYAWLAYRLAPEDRPQRCLRAAVGRQRAAHVHRHLRGHAADHAENRRSDQGLVGRPGLGVLPELHPDDRRLHRAVHPQDHAARGAARHAGRRFRDLHLDAPGAGDVHDAADRPGLLRHHHGELVRRRAISEGDSGRAGRDRRRHADRVGLQSVRARPRRPQRQGPRRRLCQFRLLGAAAGVRPGVFRLRIPRHHPGHRDPVRHLRSGRGDGQCRKRRGRGRRISDHARADRRRRRQPDRLPDGQSLHQRGLYRPSRLEGDGRPDRLFGGDRHHGGGAVAGSASSRCCWRWCRWSRSRRSCSISAC